MRIYLCTHRQFSMIGFHNLSFDSDNIPDIGFLKDFVLFFTDFIFTHINLNFTVKILNVHKSGFPLTTLCHNTAGNFYIYCLIRKLFLAAVFIFGTNLSGFMSSLICLTERIYSHSTQIFHFLTTDFFLFCQFFHSNLLIFPIKKALIR